jgi:hypothetical protein
MQVKTLVLSNRSAENLIVNMNASRDQIQTGTVEVEVPGFAELAEDGWDLMAAVGTQWGIWTFWTREDDEDE